MSGAGYEAGGSVRCFYSEKSYSSAGKRAGAYSLFCHARCSLVDDALEKFQLLGDDHQMLWDECRSNSCIELATGILEEEKALESLSKKISTISLPGDDKKPEKFLLDKLNLYESVVGDSNAKGSSRIEVFPRNPVVLDLAFNFIDFPSLENRMKKGF